MAIEIPGCCDTQYDLLRKILLSLPDIVPSEGEDLQSGSQPIGLGVDTVSVVFPTPFPSPPNIVPGISRPSAEPLITLNIDRASVTALGFTASLGALTPSANYQMTWIAHI